MADLDIAIRANGDDPNRIPEWPDIRYLLRKRFGEQSYPELLDRFRDWLSVERGFSEEEYLLLPFDEVKDLLADESAFDGGDPPTVKPKRSTVQGEDRSSSEQSDLSKPTCDVQHSSDFRSVLWFGEKYSFTATQAACVKVLWENWEQGTPQIGEQTILEAADSAQDRLVGLFRHGKHPAWGSMIRNGSNKGTFFLCDQD